MKTALILTGGGSSGAFEIGVMEELFKHITPDFFVATSSGAINLAASIAYLNEGYDSILEGSQTVGNFWRNWSKKKPFVFNNKIMRCNQKVYKFNKKMLLTPFIAKSLFYNTNLEDMLNSIFEDKKIEDLKIPLSIGTINLTTGKTEFFTKGKIVPALMASSAAVPFFPPYKYGEHHYIDGGLDIGSCIKMAAKLGAQRIILVNKRVSKEFRNNMFGIMKRTVDVIMDQHISYYVSNGFKDRIIEIRPGKEIGVQINDLTKVDDLISLGKQTVQEFMKNSPSALAVTQVQTISSGRNNIVRI